jgi:hypothetical protein
MNTNERLANLVQQDIRQNESILQELRDTLDAEQFCNKMLEKKVRFKKELAEIMSQEPLTAFNFED